jgi:hypothetical protein
MAIYLVRKEAVSGSEHGEWHCVTARNPRAAAAKAATDLMPKEQLYGTIQVLVPLGGELLLRCRIWSYNVGMTRKVDYVVRQRL